MELDTSKYDYDQKHCSDAQYWKYEDWQIEQRPNIEDRGYCPILDGKATGRYMYYMVAEGMPHDIIVAYRDLERFGYTKETKKKGKK
jgi:hypothetical protein